jgi:hypothetical protein
MGRKRGRERLICVPREQGRGEREMEQKNEMMK